MGTYTGNLQGIERLNIPPINMQDGPQGFRANVQSGGKGSSTSWPSALTITASWDEDLIYEWASAMASEFRAKGANMLLGPGIGIARFPFAGRNFEYLCGEDPILGAKLVKPLIKGIHSQGVLANPKHWVNNEMEKARMRVSSNVDEKTRFELYYPPFEAAIDAGALTIMCSYNRLDGIYSCENEQTLKVDLRERLGFKGFVVSDWTATKSTTESLKAGLDIEMPSQAFYHEQKIQEKLDAGEITMQDIDDRVFNTLNVLYSFGLVDNPIIGDPQANVTSVDHNKLARKVASSSSVLLKNDNILPLKLSNEALGSCISVFGDEDTIAGSGSGGVQPAYIITPQQGIQGALHDAGIENIEVFYSAGKDLNEASTLASKCKYSVVALATTSAEGKDRSTLSLGDENLALINAVIEANPEGTIAVINSPGSCLIPFHDRAKAILFNGMPGQEYGNAIADIIFGKVSPAGRLPVTIPNKDNEIPFSQLQYPGVGTLFPESYYTERTVIGYRYYNVNNITPLYSFGYGLTYSTFAYGQELTLTSKVKEIDHVTPITSENKYDELVTLSFSLSNTGSVDTSEVVQVYLEFPQTLESNVFDGFKQLKQFKKVFLTAGETKEVTLDLTRRDLSYWNVPVEDIDSFSSQNSSWKLIKGELKVYVGASSTDMKISSSIQI